LRQFGTNDSGDYSLFATETYYFLKKNVPEFDELAAMESGYAWRPITVRREGPQNIAQSVMGTFVSGNYFRVFGLTPAAGRFFVDWLDAKIVTATSAGAQTSSLRLTPMLLLEHPRLPANETTPYPAAFEAHSTTQKPAGRPINAEAAYKACPT
jgi:hypothetical protein